MSEKLYKIRRKSDGLYSMGRQYLYFTKNGKTWSSIGALSSHIAMAYHAAIVKKNGKIIGIDMSKIPHNHPYAGCEIVEAEVIFNSKKDVDLYAQDRYNMGMKPEAALN